MPSLGKYIGQSSMQLQEKATHGLRKAPAPVQSEPPPVTAALSSVALKPVRRDTDSSKIESAAAVDLAKNLKPLRKATDGVGADTTSKKRDDTITDTEARMFGPLCSTNFAIFFSLLLKQALTSVLTHAHRTHGN